MQQNRSVLIVAQSGRALTASATKAGITVCVIDRFADQETCELAASVQTCSGTGSGFNVVELQTVLHGYRTASLSGIVVGSGLESEPEILDWISERWILYGNGSETVRRCKDPAQFFPLLDRLEILHPDVSYELPVDGNGWLIKKTGGSGGEHITNASACAGLPENYYAQKKISGQNLSAVFIADGHNVLLIGVSETWTVDPGHDNYAYAGAVNLPDVDEMLLVSMKNIISSLTTALKLKGLCGIDFIVDETGKVYVLEINPRPTATFELHDLATNSLFQAHILACEGKFDFEFKTLPGYRAQRVIYTDSDLAIPEISWPDWISDRPAAGTIINSGMPVCMVHAESNDLVTVKNILNSRTESTQDQIRQYCLAA